MKFTKGIIISIIGVLCSSLFFGYTFAENNQKQCSACSATPDGMQMYINFQVELLGILQGSESRQQTTSKISKKGLFGGGVLSVPKAFGQAILNGLKKSANKELQAARALGISSVLTYKLTLSHALSDGLLSISILFRNESFVRDYKILQEIDMSTNDIIRDMAQLGIWNKKVTPDVYAEIRSLQNTYTKEHGGRYPIFEKFEVANDVKNSQLLTFLYRLNSLMKGVLHNVENPYLLKGNIVALEDLLYDEGSKIEIKFNEDYLDYVLQGYECAVGGCDYGTKRAARTLAKDFVKTMSGVATSFKNSMTTIATSSIELKDAIVKAPKTYTKTVRGSDNNGGLTDKQIQLLRTVYGVDTKHLTTSQLETFKMFRKKTQEEIQPAIDLYKAAKDGVIDAKEELQKILHESGNIFSSLRNGIFKGALVSQKEAISNLKKDKEELKNIPPKAIELSQAMESIVIQSLASKNQDKNILLGSTNQDTLYFVQIGEYIHQAIINEDINGTDGLVQKLGDVCTYQCENKGTRNCFAK